MLSQIKYWTIGHWPYTPVSIRAIIAALLKVHQNHYSLELEPDGLDFEGLHMNSASK